MAQPSSIEPQTLEEALHVINDLRERIGQLDVEVDSAWEEVEFLRDNGNE